MLIKIIEAYYVLMQNAGQLITILRKFHNKKKVKLLADTKEHALAGRINEVACVAFIAPTIREN